MTIFGNDTLQGPQLPAVKTSIFKALQYEWGYSSGLCATFSEDQSCFPSESEIATEEDTCLLTK